MTPLTWADRALGSPFRVQPQRVLDWLRETGRTPTLTEIQQRFGWSGIHTIRVMSRLPLVRL